MRSRLTLAACGLAAAMLGGYVSPRVSASINEGVLSDGRPYKFPGFNRPGSILVTEAFLIEGGKIRRVEMIGPAATYHLNSPWRSLSGN